MDLRDVENKPRRGEKKAGVNGMKRGIEKKRRMRKW